MSVSLVQQPDRSAPTLFIHTDSDLQQDHLSPDLFTVPDDCVHLQVSLQETAEQVMSYCSSSAVRTLI